MWAGGELRHDRGVGLKADGLASAPIGWGRAMHAAAMQTNAPWHLQARIYGIESCIRPEPVVDYEAECSCPFEACCRVLRA